MAPTYDMRAILVAGVLGTAAAVWGVVSQRSIARCRATIEFIARSEADSDLIQARRLFIQLAKAPAGLAVWAADDKEQTEEAQAITRVLAAAARTERAWRTRLADPHPAFLPDTGAPSAPQERASGLSHAFAIPPGLDAERRMAAVAALAVRLAGKTPIDLAYRGRAVAEADAAAPGYVCPFVPLRCGFSEEATVGEAAAAFAAERARAEQDGAFAVDLPLRDPALTALTSFPVLVLAAVAISAVFAFLGFIFLIALALG